MIDSPFNIMAQVNEEILHAAFIPFGEIRSVQIAKDFVQEGKSKGFGFVEYEFEEDALAALENMDNAELYGKVGMDSLRFCRVINIVIGQVLRCSIAKPMAMAEKGKPIWTSEDFLQQQAQLKGAEADDDEEIDYDSITK